MEIDRNHDEDDNVTTATQSRKKNHSLPPTVQATPVEPPAQVPEPAPTVQATAHTAAQPVLAPADPTPEQEAERHAERARMRLADLEWTIKETAAEISGILKRAVPHARQMGDLLADAKAAIKDIDGYLTFAEWVRDKCGMTIQTANRYIRLAANWERMTGTGYEPTSIEDADEWIAINPAPDADKRGGANNQTGPRIKKLELPKTFFTAKRLQRSGKSAEDWKAVANEALQAAGVHFQFV